jgi:CheY-like chemotaxis protein
MERLGGQNHMKRPESVEIASTFASHEKRDAARIFTPLALGLLLALGASILWSLHADNLYRDNQMRRMIELHRYAGHFEDFARARELGGINSASPVEIPGEQLGYSGLKSAMVLLPDQSPPERQGSEYQSFIVRYTKSLPTGSSVFCYDDELWNRQIKNFRYLEDGIIITILSIVIIALSPVTVMLFSMLRRRDELRRFSEPVEGSPGEGINAAAMKAVVGESEIAALILDGGGKVVSMSRAAASLLEPESPGEIHDFSSIIALPGDFRKKCLSGGEAFRESIDLVMASGGVHRVEAVFQPFRTERETVGGVLFLFPEGRQTRSASREAGETELRQEEEMLAGMVRGLAHDLNNRVAGIVGAASLGIKEATVDWELAGRFRDILREAGRLSDICSELQLLLVNAGNESGICDPSHEIARISQVLRSVMPFNISVEAGGASRFKIMVDRGLLRQFFFSLALASSEMMKGGTGRIRINLSDRLPRQVLSPDLERGCRLCFRYSDGFIMPPELRDVFSAREYEPADVDRQFGTSYGTAYRASLEFGGWISFERGMGETILCLVLKGIPSSANGEQAQIPGMEAEDSLKVLLADDVDLVRETLGEFLRSQDFRVVTASDGDQAMEELAQGVFDVIILDLNMPGRPSMSIATHCLQAYDDMAVILSSGYEKPDGIQDLLDNRRVVFLPKPSPPGELVQTVITLVARVRQERGDSGEQISHNPPVPF